MNGLQKTGLGFIFWGAVFAVIGYEMYNMPDYFIAAGGGFVILVGLIMVGLGSTE